MKRHLQIKLFVLVSMIVLLMVSCLPGTVALEKQPSGFFMGIWHGWIAPVSLIVRLFKPEVRIYDPINTGWWYEFGYYMAIISGFGGLSLARRGKSHHRDDASC
ncbi:MAG: hypothetical protein WCR91_07485 [Sphaerochaetaceae bacterium]|jgi:hypothetical protein|nr:hypothetical protein [Sphaerochaetaceae bacterium]